MMPRPVAATATTPPKTRTRRPRALIPHLRDDADDDAPCRAWTSTARTRHTAAPST